MFKLTPLKVLFFLTLISVHAFSLNNDNSESSRDALHNKLVELLTRYEALKTSNDGIRNIIFESFKNYELLKILNAPEGEIQKMITDIRHKFSVYTQVDFLKRFEKEFPALYVKYNYQELLDRLMTIITEHGLSHDLPPTSEQYELCRPLQGFRGNRLVLGCGRNSTSCEGHTDSDYLLDFSSEANPDLIADYYSLEFWKEFADETFGEIFFEGFLPWPNTNSLQQLARILKPNGFVRMGYSDPDLAILKFVREMDESIFNEYIKKCGFSRFKVRLESFRSNGHYGESDMLILYK